jgi:hypothetical protein
MDKKSAIEVLVCEAETAETLAVRHCERGDHRQAAWRFEMAGDYYQQAGRIMESARCYAQAHAEQRWVRPADRINVSALVD